MAKPDPSDELQRFIALLRQEWARLDPNKQSGLDTEDAMDILWLAHCIAPSSSNRTASPTPDPSVEVRRSNKTVAPQPSGSDDSKAAIYHPPSPDKSESQAQTGLGTGLPLQVPAANALRSQLDLGRALRPLMRKIPSPTVCWWDEVATAERIAEQDIWSPVSVPAPERRFDLALVVEDTPSLKLWEATLGELQGLVEGLGIFRQVRTWRLKALAAGEFELYPNWKQTAFATNARNLNTLLDPTGRRIVWVASDCTSDLWDCAAFYRWLAKWGKFSPLAIVQLFPERLWSRTALGIGRPMRLQSATAGVTQALLSATATAVFPSEEVDGTGKTIVGEQEYIILPVTTLEPDPLNRWAKATMGVPDTHLTGLQIDFSQLGSQAQSALALESPSDEGRVRQFCATASITAQRLAGLMAAVPVSVPVANLIQQTLLPQSRQVHVAEVFMGGLLKSQPPPPDQPDQVPQYWFPESVRERLSDAVPISKTVKVIDTVSDYIAERLGLGTKGFAALVRSLSQADLTDCQRQTIQPFAQIPLRTLYRLGGEQRALAERLAQIVDLPPPGPGWPPMQEHRYRTVSVEVETLERFEFETATIERKRSTLLQRRGGWTITTAPGYGWQRVEDLGQGIQLELVEIMGGRFEMGSPPQEPERDEDEGPQHEVTLSDFFIGKYPITQEQWRAVAALSQDARDLELDPSYFKGDRRPVEQVSWDEAVEFCVRLSALTRRDYRLPTEAEWEYACRAGTTTPFSVGQTITPDLANYNGDYVYANGPKGKNRGETTPVGSLAANAFGLYDLHGNVWEWCADHWHSSYADKPDELKRNGNQPWLTAESNAERSLRGGSWDYDPWYCRSAFRKSLHPGTRYYAIGFRVVCSAARTLV